jgi:hypothetical protein
MVKLSGVWNLLSQDYIYIPNNTVIMQPSGPNPSGKLTLTNEGYISVIISNPDVARLPNGTGWVNATESQVSTVARAVVAYCGEAKTFYEGEQLVLTTLVDIALNPDWVGTTQTRNVSFIEEEGKEYMILRPVGTGFRALPVSSQPWMCRFEMTDFEVEGGYQIPGCGQCSKMEQEGGPQGLDSKLKRATR